MRDPEVRCPDCDTSNVWFAEVCTSCGTALAGTGLGSSGPLGEEVSSQLPRNPTKTCPSCGILNDDLGRFCTSCGVGNQQKWDTFVKERSGGDGGVLGLPEQAVVAFALG